MPNSTETCPNPVLTDAYGSTHGTISAVECGSNLPVTGVEIYLLVLVAVLLLTIGYLLRKFPRR